MHKFQMYRSAWVTDTLLMYPILRLSTCILPHMYSTIMDAQCTKPPLTCKYLRLALHDSAWATVTNLEPFQWVLWPSRPSPWRRRQHSLHISPPATTPLPTGTSPHPRQTSLIHGDRPAARTANPSRRNWGEEPRELTMVCNVPHGKFKTLSWWGVIINR